MDERLAAHVANGLESRWSPEQQHAVYRLSKVGIGTREAIAQVARALNVPRHALSYAGMKDKHAATAQHISVRALNSDGAKALKPERESKEWRVRLLGWTAEALDSTAILCNEFALVVRGLNASAAAGMDGAAATLTDGARGLMLVNYFGDQRFGSARHGQGFAAQPLIRGDFLSAIRLLVGTPSRKEHGRGREFTNLCDAHWGDWALLARQLPACPERHPLERLATGATPAEAFLALPKFLQGMCIEAFQSLLWNEIARRMVASQGPAAVSAADDFGPMHFPAPAKVPSEWRGLMIPLLSPHSELVSPWGVIAQQVLESFDTQLESLRVPGLDRPFFGEAPRTFLIHAEDFQMGPAQPDELGSRGSLRRSVKFSLPRGAYATVVMRALGE